MKDILRSLKSIWKLILLLLLTALAFCYAMFQGGFVSWFLFYAFLPFAVYSILLAVYPLQTFRAARTLSKDQFSAGEILKGEITLERPFPFPLIYIIAEECLPSGLKQTAADQPARKLFFLGFRRKAVFTYTVQSMKRGEHHFSRIRIKTGDLLGLFEKEVTMKTDKTILVYPTAFSMGYRHSKPQYEQGASASSQRYIKDTTMASGIREYQPGDRMAWIDWKATAKRDSFMTKEFEQTRTHDVMLIMDQQASDSFEPMITFTASLAKAIIKTGAPLGFILLGTELDTTPVQPGEKQLQTIFRKLARVNPEPSSASFSIWEERMASQGGYRSSNLFIVSVLTMELVRKLEHRASYSDLKLYFIRKKNQLLTQEEEVLLDRLNKRGIAAEAVSEGFFDQALKEVKSL
ncbi:DUF58 domain-containing protein [Bacillus sp. SJS]|uniref:DUF58 domain-containing protein n=1 Tax=Bacillus sp. SJS TaxID=1423321 RepID=UPI0004DD31E7|nr:DUF58 domain-containing protein [Bacillus sp. SJS]KZZ85562.1 hypothetical protein AS29_004840 [Bacillus sp. SJS]